PFARALGPRLPRLARLTGRPLQDNSPAQSLGRGTTTVSDNSLLLQAIRSKPRSRFRRLDKAMYVCVCNAIRETELRDAARALPGDAEAVYEQLGKSPQCCQGLEEADDRILEEPHAT